MAVDPVWTTIATAFAAASGAFGVAVANNVSLLRKDREQREHQTRIEQQKQRRERLEEMYTQTYLALERLRWDVADTPLSDISAERRQEVARLLFLLKLHYPFDRQAHQYKMLEHYLLFFSKGEAQSVGQLSDAVQEIALADDRIKDVRTGVPEAEPKALVLWHRAAGRLIKR